MLVLIKKSVWGCLFILLTGCAGTNSKVIEQYRASIEKQVDVQLIKDLQTRYLLFYDAMEGRDPHRPSAEYIVDQLFVEGGVWMATNENDSAAYRGKTELTAMFKEVEERHVADRGHYVKHFSMNPQISIDGDKATLKAQFLVLHSSKKKKQSYWIIGHYTDLLEKNSSSEWRFKSKTAHIEDFTTWSLKQHVDKNE